VIGNEVGRQKGEFPDIKGAPEEEMGIIFQNAKWVEEDSWTLFEFGPIVFLSEKADCCGRGRREDEVGEAGIELAFPFRGVKDGGEEELVRGVYFLFGHDFTGNLQTGFVN